MTYRDQADFLIADVCIHRGPVAWKLGATTSGNAATVRIHSIRAFGELVAANLNGSPAFIHDNLEPIQTDRSAFGVLRPVLQRSDDTG